MTLRETVDKYRTLVKNFAEPVSLAGFDLSPQQTEKLFSGYDEDYHISRFFHFSLSPPAQGAPRSSPPQFRINGFPYSHVSIDEAILEIL